MLQEKPSLEEIHEDTVRRALHDPPICLLKGYFPPIVKDDEQPQLMNYSPTCTEAFLSSFGATLSSYLPSSSHGLELK